MGPQHYLHTIEIQTLNRRAGKCESEVIERSLSFARIKGNFNGATFQNGKSVFSRYLYRFCSQIRNTKSLYSLHLLSPQNEEGLDRRSPRTKGELNTRWEIAEGISRKLISDRATRNWISNQRQGKLLPGKYVASTIADRERTRNFFHL